MKLKKLLYIIFIVLQTPLLYSQTSIDSLKEVLRNKEGADRIDALLGLSRAHKRVSPDKTVEYALEAYHIAKQENNELLIAASLASAGDGELLLGNLDTAKKYYLRTYKIYDQLKDLKGLSEIYLDLGNIYFYNSMYDSAATYYNKSITLKNDLGHKEALINLYNNLGAIYKKTGRTKQAIEALNNSIEMCDQLGKKNKKGLALINLASIYFTQGELSRAIKYNFDALAIAEENNDLYTISNAYTNLGNIYTLFNDYEIALSYHNRTLAIDRNLNDWEGIITAYNNIGNIYIEQNKVDSAQFFFDRALKLHQTKGLKVDIENTMYNLGKTYKIKRNYDKALDYLNHSLDISTKINDLELIIENKLAIGETLLNQNKVKKAEEHLLEAYALTNEIKLKNEYQLYLLLSKLFQRKNDLNKALSYHIKYANLKDSVVNIQRAITVSEIKSSYELQKQIEEIELLSNNNRLQQEKIERQNNFRNILIVGSLTILLLLIIQILNFRNKQKANKILQKQNEQIKNKNDEIKQKTDHLAKVNQQMEKLSIAASKTDNAILITDAKGKIEWINEGHTRLYGYSLNEFIKKHGGNLLEASSSPEIKEIFEKAIAERESQKYESEVITRDGSKYNIHTTLTPVFNENNEISRLIAIDSDVTKQKKVEEELQKLLITKDKFFSIIAHDLKNPFNSLIGLSQLLVHGYDRLSSEKVKYFHNNLYQISKNGYELLINLLEWSRSQMGSIQFKPVEVSLSAIVEETFSLYSSKATQKEITLTNNIEDESTLFADHNMLKTILRNLVSNALKFTERGGAIEITEKNTNGYKEISVRDTGIGIPPDDVDKLFYLDENFTTEGTEDESGTGLGLLLCKEFVTKHGGEITVESKVGFGSRFIFTLPKK